MLLALADGTRRVLHLCGQTGNPSRHLLLPPWLGLAASAPGGLIPSTWVCSSLHASELLKGPERGWLEHVVQSGWMKNRMWDRPYTVLSFPAPLVLPCRKLQARVSLPSFLLAVSANVAAIIDGVQHAEPSASKLLWLLVVSCTL